MNISDVFSAYVNYTFVILFWVVFYTPQHNAVVGN